MQSVYLIIPLTRRAKKWVDDNIQLESWQWQPVGGRLQGFAVEARYVENILNGMTADGLVYGTDFKTEPPLVQPHQESQGSPYMLFIFHQVLAQEQFERYADQKNILMKKHSVHRISISQSKGQEILYFMQAQGFKYYYDFETLPPLNPKITFEILDPADQGTNPRRRNPNDINQLGNLYDMSQFLVEAGEGDTWFKVVHVSDQLVSYVDYPSVLPSGKELSWSRDGAEYWKHKTRRVRQAIQLTVTGNNVSCEHYFKDRGFDANAVLPTVCYIVMSQNFSGQNNPRRHNPFGDDTPEMKKHMTEILTADRKMMRRRKRHLTTEEISDWAMRTWGDQAEKIMDEINEYRKTPGGRKLWKFLFIEIYGIFKK